MLPWNHQAPVGGGHRGTGCGRRELTGKLPATRRESTVPGQGRGETWTSFCNGVSVFLVFHLFLRCTHIIGSFLSPACKWSAPDLNLSLRSPVRPPTRLFPKRGATSYQIELSREVQ